MPYAHRHQDIELLPELEVLLASDEKFEAEPLDRPSERGVDADPLDRLLESEFEEEFKRGSREYVRWVQRSLNDLIGAGLSVDGINGRDTRAAVRNFQRQARIVVDGAVGPQTERAMIRAGVSAPPNLLNIPGASARIPRPLSAP